MVPVAPACREAGHLVRAAGCAARAERRLRVAPTGPSPTRQLVKKVLAAVLPPGALLLHGARHRPRVYLTFDDGPHPEHTPALLDTLAALGARATFFVVGERAARFPGLVRRMVAEGHEIGNHSYTHSPPERTGARQLVEEAETTASLLGDIVGQRPVLFRPPHGKLTAAKLLGLWAAGMNVVLWSNDPKDFACSGPQEALEAIGRCPPMNGDIVLLHDTWPYAPALTAELVRSLRESGLSTHTVTTWA